VKGEKMAHDTIQVKGMGEMDLHWIRRGSGRRPLVCVHGNLANTLWWEPFFDQIPDDYTAYALDLPGSGHTPETGVRHTIDYFVEVLAGFVAFLELDHFDLMGHSMGGGVSQLFTLAYPEKVRRLVLLDSMAADGFHVLYEAGEASMRVLRENRQALEKALRNVAPYCHDDALFARITDVVWHASDQVYFEQPVTMHEANWFDRLAEIQIPVLFLHGDEDQFMPKAGSERTAAAMPDCQFRYLDACGHSPNVEIPERLAKEVFGFLNSDD
jgi:pimeloyl-ACP methyl ester carboxylesterase